jgi:hypothetical protein
MNPLTLQMFALLVPSQEWLYDVPTVVVVIMLVLLAGRHCDESLHLLYHPVGVAPLLLC